jgi:hypothetical protein
MRIALVTESRGRWCNSVTKAIEARRVSNHQLFDPGDRTDQLVAIPRLSRPDVDRRSRRHAGHGGRGD